MHSLALSRALGALALCSLVACDDPLATPDAAQDAGEPSIDASQPLDARTTPVDARMAGDAGVTTDSGVVDAIDASIRDAGPEHWAWQDGPSDAPPAPRTVCSWSNIVFPGNEAMPAHFQLLRVDSAGNVFVAGKLSESRDFGTGLVALPWLNSKFATTLFKFDASCHLVWVKALLPHDAMISRTVLALGFDGQNNPTLLTSSFQSTGVFHGVEFQASSIEITRLANADGAQLSEKVIPTGTSPLAVTGAQVVDGGPIVVTAQASYGLDLGMGPIPTDQGAYYNAFFSSTGELQRSELFGQAGDSDAVQVFNAAGEVVNAGYYIHDYFGVQAANEPTLLKLTASRQLLWRASLESAAGSASISLSATPDFTLAVGESFSADDGTYSTTHSVSVFASDGTRVYRIPLTTAPDAGNDQPTVRIASRALVAMLSGSNDTTKLGNATFRPAQDGGNQWIALLGEGGTPRFLQQYPTTIGGPKDFAVDPAGNVSVAIESIPTLSLSKLAAP